jgi:TRAP-type C4-dicarboxylate transport system permease small subunit
MTMATLNTSRESAARSKPLTAIRRSLDFVYLASGYLAAASMVAILLLTLAQVFGRYAGFNFRGLTDYAGYVMASAAFMAFAHTLNSGNHIRIELFLSITGRFRPWLEVLALAISTLVAGWFAYHACLMAYWSYAFGDLSTGMDATPLWIPQLSMAVGSVLLAVALADNLIRFVFTGSSGVPRAASGH